ncbi:MAG: 23S rRNA (adenine(2503)-C(2))-methyltransferase RlmN [Alphaproteobacteria bacterium]|jgi:23S rRNA (adenine2503-C2)-methyltransferase|nr:23S rRNA (adenine(2503)-C(2))-methyltransferase RlmN [Alphaproteobacteria bacterium]
MKENLLGKSFEDLTELVATLGEKPFRTKQLWHFMYVRGVKTFAEMALLPASLREKLEESYTIERPTIITEQKSVDGTIKYLLQLLDGKEIETVYIPSMKRGTLCISSQVGCNMGCTFCHTGTQKMVRNLTAGEIVGQVMLVKDILSDFGNIQHPEIDEDEDDDAPSNLHTRAVSNVVYMGMGEPLQNYKEVVRSIKILNSGEGLAISRRKITVSTSGIIPNIRQLYKDIPVNLSISIHAPNNTLRSKIMPINNQYPLEELIKVAQEYYNNSNAKRITFAYLMIKDVNDSDEHLRELAKIGKQVPSKFNLIPFHPWDGCDYESSATERIQYFSDYLHNIGFTSTLRKTRGDDILAACGQLKSKTQREKKIPKKEIHDF